MQADVLGLRQELQERQQRVGGRATGGDEVVVVDEHDHLRAAPPAAFPQLTLPDGRARQPPRRDAAMSWAASAAASAELA